MWPRIALCTRGDFFFFNVSSWISVLLNVVLPSILYKLPPKHGAFLTHLAPTNSFATSGLSNLFLTIFHFQQEKKWVRNHSWLPKTLETRTYCLGCHLVWYFGGKVSISKIQCLLHQRHFPQVLDYSRSFIFPTGSQYLPLSGRMALFSFWRLFTAQLATKPEEVVLLKGTIVYHGPQVWWKYSLEKNSTRRFGCIVWGLTVSAQPCLPHWDCQSHC